MRRSLIKRRFSAAVLVFVSALLLIAVAPLLLDLRSADFARGVLGVQALPADTIIVDQPLKLSLSPAITLTSGIVSLGRTTSEAGKEPSRSVILNAPVLDIVVAGGDTTIASGADPIQLAFAPLIEHIAALSIDRLALRNGTIRLHWGGGHSVDLTKVTAEVLVRNKQPVSASGTLTYLAEPYTFESQFGAVIDRIADADGPNTARRPMQFMLKSVGLNLTFDGHIDIAEAMSLKGQADARTPDAGKLAADLGYTWSGQSGGPAIQLKGPARWANGSISFGRSDVSISDQAGVGAVTLSVREGRPRIEATLAFPALDVAPLLQRQKGSGLVSSLAPSLAPSLSPSLAPWRTIGTAFQSITRLDAELRLSAARLQWNGAPVGRGAMTVSASSGRLHGDIAELDLGTHAGSLQFMVDHTTPDAPVSLRGRVETTDIALLAGQLFGTSPLRGRATSQFDLTGRGATLGEVMERAGGRGTLDMRDGQMLLDLAGLQKQSTSIAQGERPAGWGTLAQIAALDALDARFRLRDGVLTFDHLSAISKGLVASVQGHVGITSADLDLAVRIAPAALPRLGPARAISASPTTGSARDTLMVRGTWSAPKLSPAEIALTP